MKIFESSLEHSNMPQGLTISSRDNGSANPNYSLPWGHFRLTNLWFGASTYCCSFVESGGLLYLWSTLVPCSELPQRWFAVPVRTYGEGKPRNSLADSDGGSHERGHLGMCDSSIYPSHTLLRFTSLVSAPQLEKGRIMLFMDPLGFPSILMLFFSTPF